VSGSPKQVLQAIVMSYEDKEEAIKKREDPPHTDSLRTVSLERTGASLREDRQSSALASFIGTLAIKSHLRIVHLYAMSGERRKMFSPSAGDTAANSPSISSGGCVDLVTTVETRYVPRRMAWYEWENAIIRATAELQNLSRTRI
jgi:hypothetical protein